MATGGENSSDIDVGCATLRSCDPCKKDNTTKDATQFCTECVEFLCDDCKRGHSRFKAGNHSFIFAADVTDVPVVVDMKDIDKCEEHKKKLKFFCKDHSFLCCSTCAFIHRTCKSVEEIAKISDKMKENLKELHDSLVKVGDKERLKIEDCTKTVDTLEGKVTQFQKTIDIIKEETIKLFETAKSRITYEANTILATESERLGERKISSENTLKIISEILPLCLGVINNGTPQQAFIFAKYIEQKLKEIENHDREQRKKHFKMQLSLEFAKETASLISKGPAVVILNDERQNINTKGGGYNNYNQGGGGYRGGGGGSYNNYQGGGFSDRGGYQGRGGYSGGNYRGGFQNRGGGNDRGGYQNRGAYNSGGNGGAGFERRNDGGGFQNAGGRGGYNDRGGRGGYNNYGKRGGFNQGPPRFDQPSPNFIAPPPQAGGRWEGLVSEGDQRPTRHYQSGQNYDVNSRWDNRSDNDRYSGTETTKENWAAPLPANPRIEEELFGSSNTGINFDKYEDIPVDATGEDCPKHIETM
ncbi:uncharacterized protein LOC127836476 isoform X2 [Dreissena polymorpha]|uniref:uncharacterized protein LOC127836476 isoform X2 n=1 Tax=Dreissena polymorpha TaxID=45954 RepID=UPI0022650DF8|nr:uncharacterized protein LOC127836476 isoform X2 [Dreissena polymorpha]